MSRKKAPFKDYEGSKQNDKHIRKTENMMSFNICIKISGVKNGLIEVQKIH